jgi:alpha-tubulin suppressor-like RCC1 family protein
MTYPAVQTRTGSHGWAPTALATIAAVVVATGTVASLAIAPSTVAKGGHPAAGRQASDGDTTSSWGHFDTQQGGGHESTSPTPVGNLTNITQIAAGNASYMALDSSGHVWTWGLGANGVLGDGSTKNHTTSAVEVEGLPTIVSIAEADNTDVALDASGHVWGWGWNEAAQLCEGNKAQHSTPVELKHLSGVAAMAGGGTHMVYLLANGTLEACGFNSDGQLGNGTFASSKVPVTVVGLPSSVAAISAGQAASTALLTNGQVWDWGYNKWGQLGDGSTTNSDTPVQVRLPLAATQVYTGGDEPKNGQSLALLSDGTIWGWGNNQWGQLGNGTETDSSMPVQATKLPTGVTFDYVVSGGAHSLALDSHGNVWAWGDSRGVGSGSSGSVLTPIQVMSGADIISATANDSVVHAG